jgi:uncharacterized membrane protein YuzA (DUF378 family)
MSYLYRNAEGGDNVKGLRKLAYILVVIGALNWGLIGFFNYNFVSAIFSGIAGIIYVLVGLSGVILLLGWGKD